MNRPDYATPPAGYVPEIRYDTEGTLVDVNFGTRLYRHAGLSPEESSALCEAICAQVELAIRWKYEPRPARLVERDDPWL